MKEQSVMVVQVVPVSTNSIELKAMFDLLLLSEMQLAEAKAKLAKATKALEDLERVNAGGGSAYRSIQILQAFRLVGAA